METKLHALKQPMDHWRNQRKIKQYLKTKYNEYTMIQNIWDAAKKKKTSKREVYSKIILPQETRKISNNLTLHLKQLETTSKSQS